MPESQCASLALSVSARRRSRLFSDAPPPEVTTHHEGKRRLAASHNTLEARSASHEVGREFATSAGRAGGRWSRCSTMNPAGGRAPPSAPIRVFEREEGFSRRRKH